SSALWDVRLGCVRAALFGAAIDHVFRHDLGLEGEQLSVRRIDDNAHPMTVRGPERFQSGEVFKRPPGLGADKRLVDAEGMAVAVDERRRSVEALHLLDKCLDVVVMTSRKRRA